MRVWNKEITHCGHCGLCTLEFKAKDDEIHPDCKYLKSITKEVIESFGFKSYNKPHTYHFWVFPDLIKPKFEITRMSENGYIIEDLTKHIFLYDGTINNPEELKFILIAIGVM